jgi:Ser/Thr protein kinase RdoA (MazF antagonist)
VKAEFDLLVELNGRRMPKAIEYTTINGTPVALIEFIDGVHKNFNDLTPSEIEELARAMSDLHCITSELFSITAGAKPTHRGTYADYIRAMVSDSIASRLNALRESGNDLSVYDVAYSVIDAGLRKLDALLADNPDEFSGGVFGLLHHDLNPYNVIWKPDGSVVFIDPNPTHGDPLDDVNYVITNNQGSAYFQTKLLKAYSRVTQCSKISAVRMEAYTLKNWLDDLVWTIAMCEQYKDSPDSEICDKYAELYASRLASLRHLLGVA